MSVVVSKMAAKLKASSPKGDTAVVTLTESVTSPDPDVKHSNEVFEAGQTVEFPAAVAARFKRIGYTKD